MAGIDYKVEGLDELLSKLKTVDHDMSHKGGRFALRKAAQVIRDQVKANASRIDDPQTAADIAKNVVERWSGRTFKRTGNLMFRVGIMGGAGGNKPSEAFANNPGLDTRHWRYLEFGTQSTPANPFFRRAMDKGQEATSTFIKEYDKALDRAIKRAKKGKK